MLTPWGAKLDKEHILQEYPRPQFQRDSYLSLNGTWHYAVTPKGAVPMKYDGEILVPFSPESVLSGVDRILTETELLWYHRTVIMPEGFNRGRLLLHFGAVDQTATVYVNGRELMTHIGGFTPFTVDITDAVDAEFFDLMLRVTDESDVAYQTCGKQRRKRGGKWYSRQSGIWQTVWLESVPEAHIRGLRIYPHFDEKQVELWVAGEGEVHVEFAGVSHDFPAGTPVCLDVPEVHPWSPEDPYLYDLTLRLGEDEVRSYFAMRKFSVETDAEGVQRLFLNGRPYFQNGVLDQGYWSDGLLTAPSDEAMIYDIELAKRLGFNMIRKHCKIEPLRWYYHCDRLGMLVWQDMPSGGKASPLAAVSPRFLPLRDHHYALFGRKSEESRSRYYAELREMINALINCPCIAMWVPFSEGRGQFDSALVSERIRAMDPTRMIDHASGWHDQGIGEVCSRHVYAKTYRFRPDRRGRAVILSEFGGYTLRIDAHASEAKEFGYRRFDTANSYFFALRELYHEQVLPAMEDGLAAAVYTQLSDVEDALDGFVTFDRRVVKVPPDLLRRTISRAKLK